MIKNKKTQKLKEKNKLDRHDTRYSLVLAIGASFGLIAYAIWYIQSGVTASIKPESLNDIFESYLLGAAPVLILSILSFVGLIRIIKNIAKPDLHVSIQVALIVLGSVFSLLLFIHLDLAGYFSPDSGRNIFSF